MRERSTRPRFQGHQQACPSSGMQRWEMEQGKSSSMGCVTEGSRWQIRRPKLRAIPFLLPLPPTMNIISIVTVINDLKATHALASKYLLLWLHEGFVISWGIHLHVNSESPGVSLSSREMLWTLGPSQNSSDAASRSSLTGKTFTFCSSCISSKGKQNGWKIDLNLLFLALSKLIPSLKAMVKSVSSQGSLLGNTCPLWSLLCLNNLCSMTKLRKVTVLYTNNF